MDATDRERMRAKRAAELEEKKKKLEAMRRRKTVNIAQSVETPEPVAVASSSFGNKTFDEYIENILKPTEEETVEKIDNLKSSEEPISNSKEFQQISLAEKLASLSTCPHVGEINVQSMIVETYAKHTQTDAVTSYDIDQEDIHHPSSPTLPVQKQESPVIQERKNTDHQDSKENNTELSSQQKELSKDDIQVILASDNFRDFLDRTSRVVERALGQGATYDIMIDYSGGKDVNLESSRSHSTLEKKMVLSDDRWTKNRAITDIATSPLHKELILCSYNYPRDSNGAIIKDWHRFGAGDPDGIVLLWSTALVGRPEYVFTCPTPIMAVCFDPFNANIIIGGSYSGQIFQWDIRARSLPINRTPLSANGHTHPVYCLEIIGTKNAHNLVSGSTDGRICVWSPDQWGQPIYILELQQVVTMPSISSTLSTATSRSRKIDVALTTMAFRKNESNELTVGTESGVIYPTQIHNSSTTTEEQQKISSRERIVSAIFGGHFGPITSMQYNPFFEGQQESLLLTSSVDWSCKLWSPKCPTTPIFSFENANDCVYDIRWSPIHPTLFVAVDGTGNLSLWNIDHDTDVPIAQLHIADKAINRVRWSNDGKQLALGDSSGALYICDISSEVATPRGNEKTRLDSKIVSMVHSLQLNQM